MSGEETQFPVVMRGYERGPVDDAILDLRKELMLLSAQNAQLAQELKDAVKTSEAAQAALSEAADPTYSGVGARAALILSTAEDQAQNLLSDATREIERQKKALHDEIEDLRGEAKGYYDSLVAEAQRRADRLMNAATVEYDQAIADAKTKGAEIVDEAVREAADAAFKIAKPGVKFREIHAAAMKVIAQKTAEWGLLPVSAEESLEPDNQFHRRWMIHGTSHHLGMDVHDCAQARREMYLDAELKPGMIFTIEPGLYFHKDDLLVPKKFRGIGVRIEDDVLVTKNGVENLTKALPRKARDVEAWMQKLAN
mgnify:CR=1 FL=1